MNKPEPIKPPFCRIIREGYIGDCPLCHSTMLKQTIFGKKFCINPDCNNYHLSKNNIRVRKLKNILK